MVYIDPKNLGYQPYMDRWINRRCKSEQEFFHEMCEKYVHGALKLIIDGMLGLQQVIPLKMIIPQTALNMVMQLCHMIDGLCPSRPVDETPIKQSGEILSHDEEVSASEKLAERNDLLEAVYIQSCYCSLGASLVAKSRTDFDEYVKKISGLMMVEDTPEKLATIRKCRIEAFNCFFPFPIGFGLERFSIESRVHTDIESIAFRLRARHREESVDALEVASALVRSRQE